MSAALSRRDEGCASDLALDRWLLGELPGSDEGRRLEQHLKTCASCGARVKALRSLYLTVPVTTVRSERLQPARPPRIDPATDGVMQVAILRDGLLVGTQVFTPGHYLVGSAPEADLQLEDLAPQCAQLYFRAGHTAVEAAEAPLYVNGFPMTCATVRPIDEIGVGPYTLRVRIIQARWEPKLKVVPPPPPSPPVAQVAERTEVVTVPGTEPGRAPAAKPVQLKAQLYWGDRLVEAASFGEAPAEHAFDGWGIEALRGHALAAPTAEGFSVHVPPELKGTGGEVQLALGQSLRLTHGALTLLLTVVEAPPAAARGSWKDLPWVVLSLCAILSLGVFALALFAPDAEDEPAFTPHAQVAIKALLTPPPPKPVQVAQTETLAMTMHDRDTPPKTPPRVAPPPTKKYPAGLGGLTALTRLTDSPLMKKLLDGKVGPGQRLGGGHSMSLIASLAKGGGNSPGLGIDPHANGIGAAGLLKGVGLHDSSLGHGKIRGRVDRPDGGGIRDVNGAGVDREEIARVINSHLSEISSCYERSMLKEGSFGGKLVIEWSIGGAGSVTSARVANATITSPSMSDCVLGKLKKWTFKAPRGGGTVKVSYPFMFQAVGY